MTAISVLPPFTNSPAKDYAPGSPERAALRTSLERVANERIEIPCVIGGRELRSGQTFQDVMPHAKDHVLADVHAVGASGMDDAVRAAEHARAEWASWSWEDRAAVFLRAAEMAVGPWRSHLTAVGMLSLSKNVQQGDGDMACQIADLWRFNTEFMRQIYSEQPISVPGVWNRAEYRPLEGFVLAISPFNFASNAANLATAPALMGNSVIWKPAGTAAYPAYRILQLLRAAGLPDGVINLVHGPAEQIVDAALGSRGFAGLHFTGSTGVFSQLWTRIGNQIGNFRNYPRIVGETGGKGFVLAHPSADVDVLATALVRGAFEYQGQKCSAASRVYAPSNLWPALAERLRADVAELGVGDVADFRNYMGAVIDERAYTKHVRAIEEAKADPNAEIIVGGGYSDQDGYFVDPTVIVTSDPDFRLLRDELFGPILTVYVYPEDDWSGVLELVDKTSEYALTGSVFSDDRAALTEAARALSYTAGNLYLNDKPTGSLVAQQPLGGSRSSGTNDKVGSMWNLARWVSPRVVKETLLAPTDYRYPYMAAE